MTRQTRGGDDDLSPVAVSRVNLVWKDDAWT